MIKRFLFGLVCWGAFQAQAQDLNYVKQVSQELTHKKYWGRGYTKSGMLKASNYLEKEYQKLNLKPLFGASFKQEFTFAVNTFPKQVKLTLNGKKLKTGKEFIVKANSPGIKQEGILYQQDSLNWENSNKDFKLQILPKLTWSVGRTVSEQTLVQVLKPIELTKEVSYAVNIDQELQPEFKAYNVGGWIKGTEKPEEYLVITAHYDHLGGLGNKTYFPGANDNASGTAFMLSLAKYYSQNPPPYSIVFLACAAEEAGILGSKYYTENPAFDLNKIKFVFNFDLMGNGEEGATIVNASVFPKQFEVLKGINDKGNYLKALNSRGKAANSDHYYFSEKGVPSFFMYTQGGGPAYHDVDDQGKNLKFPVYESIFQLITKFNAEVMK